MSRRTFVPEPALVSGLAQEGCRAIVIIPARNEEDRLPATLDALAGQADLTGAALPATLMETLLLLNNCTDTSANVAKQWQAAHPGFALEIIERTLPPEVAHVGTARRLLMDTAWYRLQAKTSAHSAIMSTDADTIVSSDWVAQNLSAIARGADAVGGVIGLMDGDLESLPPGARNAYLLDREYQALVAEFEHHLDPQEGDPWPRHLEHFGASLACTPEIYAAAGGLPPVKPLEDVAFVDALRRIGARLRHDPAVNVRTSARFDGRAEVGLSGQLRIWQEMNERGDTHLVRSCEWLMHRFCSLRKLRLLCDSPEPLVLDEYPRHSHKPIRLARNQGLGFGEFLLAIDCNRLIDETFVGELESDISSAIDDLKAALQRVTDESPSRDPAAASGSGSR